MEPDTKEVSSNDQRGVRAIPFLAYGVCLIAIGFTIYLFGVALALPRNLLGLSGIFLKINEWIVWYSGVPVFFGLALSAADLFVLLPR